MLKYFLLRFFEVSYFAPFFPPDFCGVIFLLTYFPRRFSEVSLRYFVPCFFSRFLGGDFFCTHIFSPWTFSGDSFVANCFTRIVSFILF